MTELAALLGRQEIDHAPAGISAAAKDELGWPRVTLFRSLLLASWHKLSDIKAMQPFCRIRAQVPEYQAG